MICGDAFLHSSCCHIVALFMFKFSVASMPEEAVGPPSLVSPQRGSDAGVVSDPFVHVDRAAEDAVVDLPVTSVIRRRVSIKRPATALEAAAAVDEAASGQAADAESREPVASARLFAGDLRTTVFPDEDQWSSLGAKKQYDWIYERVRGSWTQQRVRDNMDGTLDRDTSAHNYRAARAAFKSINRVEKRKLARTWLLECDAPEYVMARFFTNRATLQGCVRLGSVMLTYVLNEGTPLPERMERHPDVAVAYLREQKAVHELWQRITSFSEETAKELSGAHFAVCLELCPDTLAHHGTVRLHMHLFLKSNAGLAMKVPAMSELCFDGARPNQAAYQQGLTRVDKGWSGFFYCCVDKIGQVWNKSSRRPFKDFLVQSSWVMNLLQGEKITHAVARALVVRTCSNVTRQVAELDVLEREHELELVQKAQAEAIRVLSRDLKAWVQIPAVTQWERQYAEIRQRYHFLVLSGPTQMGKTMFARSLTPPGREFLEVNCSAGQEPELRAFRFSRHALILFDEIDAHQVARQRKLFQASPALVQLGASPTNCHIYKVYCHRVRFVLSSNTWESSLAELTADDRSWVVGNSVYVRIDTPLWTDAAAVDASVPVAPAQNADLEGAGNERPEHER